MKSNFNTDFNLKHSTIFATIHREKLYFVTIQLSRCDMINVLTRIFHSLNNYRFKFCETIQNQYSHYNRHV